MDKLIGSTKENKLIKSNNMDSKGSSTILLTIRFLKQKQKASGTSETLGKKIKNLCLQLETRRISRFLKNLDQFLLFMFFVSFKTAFLFIANKYINQAGSQGSQESRY